MVALGLVRVSRQPELVGAWVAGLVQALAGLWKRRLVRPESQQASPRPAQPHEKEQAMR